ncbi:TIR-like protein FxsC [Microbispora sp. H13382]|uniref:TIR-like protein FxsC n=1 Tax=Microbispora sp. H13382 TaxID=2729112 RepID=UPI001603FE73|nr:TIR-like protein FxsC [Microbispora sp. H13382]
MTTDRVSEILAEAGAPVSPRELAEVIWLALHLRDAPPGDLEGGKGGADGLGPGKGTPPEERTAPQLVRDGRAELRMRAGDGHEGAGTPVRVPAAPLMNDVLSLQRALRPIKRRVPSRRRDLLDEEATAERIAETGVWAPVMTFTPERWLDLALVIDTGPTMWPWRPLAGELREMFTRLGAFRDVRVWYLLRGRIATAPGAPPRGPAALADASGRRIVLLLSDCAGPHWWEGRAQQALHGWARRTPTAILQPLPERLWHRTAMPVVPGWATSGRPCPPNSALRFRPSEQETVPAGLPVPLLELDPLWLADWARLTATGGDAGRDGIPTAMTYVTGRRRSGARRLAAEISLALDDRVRRFKATASPEAVRLAAYTAVSAPAVPVMRYIQRSMLPGSPPSVLAEVVVSGFLRAVARDRYEFVSEEARRAVQRLVPRSESWRAVDVLRRLSAEIESRAASAATTFPALVPADRHGDVLYGMTGRPFALIDPNALGVLGDLGVSTSSGAAAGGPPGDGAGAEAAPDPARPLVAGRSVRPAAAGRRRERPRPYFYLSYAAIPFGEQGDPNAWVVRFFMALCQEITQMTSVRPEEAGFLDREAWQGGWSESTAEALAACRVFVPLYSPRYFSSERAGREWAAFRRRFTDARPAEKSLTGPIVPALWVPVQGLELPPVARGIQQVTTGLGSPYEELGLYGIMKLRRYREDYDAAIHELARRIVAVAEATPVVIGEAPRYEDVTSGFTERAARGPVPVTVIAPNLGNLPPDVPSPYSYGTTAQEWQPFRAEGDRRSVSEHIEELADARDVAIAPGGPPRQGEPSLLIVDPWTALIPEVGNVVREDETYSGYTNLIVVWRPDDRVTQRVRPYLQSWLDQARRTAFRGAAVRHVSSLRAFRTEVARVLDTAREPGPEEREGPWPRLSPLDE